MATDSIYDIDLHRLNRTYSKNDIVLVQELLRPSGLIPKTVKYYYALKAVPLNTAVTNTEFWGGYTEHLGNSQIAGAQKVPQFIWIPSYNATTNFQPKTNTVVFQNGYEQRIPDGINNSLMKLDVSFDMRTDKEAKAIMHFLRARKGVESFVVQHLPAVYADGGYKKRFYCSNFSSSFAFVDNHSIKASFVETNN